MMSASEFFDCGPEPPWLVDACDGEVMSANSEIELLYHTSFPSEAHLDTNRSTEAGPSNYVMHMDLDDVSRLNDPSVHNSRQEFDHFLQGVNLGIVPVGPQFPISPEQRSPWLSTTPPIGVQGRRFPAAPAADIFFRASKKRKRSQA